MINGDGFQKIIIDEITKRMKKKTNEKIFQVGLLLERKPI
jgi:hypothetical protein